MDYNKDNNLDHYFEKTDVILAIVLIKLRLSIMQSRGGFSIGVFVQ